VDDQTPGCGNSYTATRTWTATDACGHSSTASQTINVIDTGDPLITCPPDIEVCEGTPVGNVGTAMATDACDKAVAEPVGTRSDGLALTDPYPLKETTITWTATDACGNSSTCEQTITVRNNPACTITVTVSGQVVSDPAEFCAGSTTELCGPEGEGFTYAWTGPVSGDQQCITATLPGKYVLTVFDEFLCQSTCQVSVEKCFSNCPATIGWWQAQCQASSRKYSTTALDSIITCVNGKSSDTVLNFGGQGSLLTKFCAVMNPTKLNQRTQAKRQYAAFLANVCTGELLIVSTNGIQIMLDLDTPISCPGLSSTTIGGLVTEVDALLVSLEGQNLKNPAVKTKYSQITSCLTDINQGNIPGSVICPEHPVAGLASKPGAVNLDGEISAEDEAEAETEAAAGPAEGIELYRPSPNPFSATTRIAYAVAGSGENVQIGVFDIAGRRIRSLVSGFQAPGRYEVTWDGLGDNGTRARIGAYFIRSAVGVARKVVPVVYVR